MSEEFLDQVLSQIKNPFVKSKIRKELENHLAERIEDLDLSGVEKEYAEKLAVEAMGSPEILGKELNEIHKAYLSYFVLFAKSLALIAFVSVTFFLVIPGINRGIDYYNQRKFDSLQMYLNSLAINNAENIDYSQVKKVSKEIKFSNSYYILNEIRFGHDHNDMIFAFNKKQSLIPSPFGEYTTMYVMDISCKNVECYLGHIGNQNFVIDAKDIKDKNELILEFNSGFKQSSYRIELEGYYD